MPADETDVRRGSPVILVVDDDDYVHSTLAAALRDIHPELVRAVSGAAGLEQALLRRPDLAIIDVGLPDTDGYSLTRALRARSELASLRICILTGYEPDEASARAAGADAIIGKPFRLKELLDTVQSQLRSSPAT